MNVADEQRVAGSIAAVLLLASALAACGQAAPPPAPAPQTGSAAPPASATTAPSTPTSAAYPKLGERPGDPRRIGPDDLRLAVDSAQTAVGGSRLVSVWPVSAGGQPIWLVKLATEGPNIKQVEVDAVLRGAKTRDVEFTEQDRIRVRDLLNATKVFWPDAVKAAEKQHPDAVPSSAVLDGKVGNPSVPVWKITLLTQNEQFEYTVDAVNGSVITTKAGPKKPHDYG